MREREAEGERASTPLSLRTCQKESNSARSCSAGGLFNTFKRFCVAASNFVFDRHTRLKKQKNKMHITIETHCQHVHHCVYLCVGLGSDQTPHSAAAVVQNNGRHVEDKRQHEKKRVWDAGVHFAAASPDLPGRAVLPAIELLAR